MSNLKADTNVTLTEPAPLFASVWLALYYVLRRTFNERQAAGDTKNAKK